MLSITKGLVMTTKTQIVVWLDDHLRGNSKRICRSKVYFWYSQGTEAHWLRPTIFRTKIHLSNHHTSHEDVLAARSPHKGVETV